MDFSYDIINIIKYFYGRLLLQDIIKIVHNLSSMRKYLRKNKMDTSYMKKERAKLENISLHVINQLNITMENNNWVKGLENFINFEKLTFLDIKVFLSLQCKYLHMRTMIKSQVVTTEYNKRKNKRLYDIKNIMKMHDIEGVITSGYNSGYLITNGDILSEDQCYHFNKKKHMRLTSTIQAFAINNPNIYKLKKGHAY